LLFSSHADVVVPAATKLVPTADFVTLRRGGGLFFDRTPFIALLENLRSQAVLSNRPRRFGKSLFKSMLMAYYDVHNKGARFDALFGDLAVAKEPTKDASSFLVLSLDFSSLDCSSVEALTRSLNAKLLEGIDQFGEKYKEEVGTLSFASDDGVARLERLALHLQDCDLKLYVFVDEYDVGVGQALDNPAVHAILTVSADRAERRDSQDGKEDGEAKAAGDHGAPALLSRAPRPALPETVFKRFFSMLKAVLGGGPHRAFVTGVTPLAMTQFTSGFNIAQDLAHELEFSMLFGLREEEVFAALDLAVPQLGDAMAKKIVEQWRWADNGYHFHFQQKVGVYNTARIMYGCIHVAKKYAGGARKVLDLLSFAPDPNTKAADATLQLLARSPHAASVFVDALDRTAESKTASRLKLTGSNGYPLPRFRLGDLLGELDPADGDRSALLSFLWYLGGLTCVPGQKGQLKVPNKTARGEILQEARKFFNWLPAAPDTYRQAIAALFGSSSDAAPLCRLVQQHQFAALKDNQVQHNNEAAVLQAFLAACVLPFAWDSTAEPECRVDPHQPPNVPGKAIDLVVSKGGKRVAFEFMNVLAWNVFEMPASGGASLKRPAAAFKRSTWQDQTKWSKQILNLDDDAVWRCSIYDIELKRQVSLETLVNTKKTSAKAKYGAQLQGSAHAGRLHAIWVVCRVGLHRVVWRQVTL
jgi:hypothetical protein